MRKILASLLTVALLHTNLHAAMAVTAKVVAPTRAAVGIAAPVSVPKLGAQPGLVILNAQLQQAPAPGAPAVETVLNAHFDASVQPKAELSEPVLGGSGGKGFSPLGPSSNGGPSNGFNEPPGPRNNQRGMAKTGLIAVIAGVVVVIGIIVALVINNGKKQNELFENSPANSDIVLVDQAQRAGAAATLDQLGDEAAARQAKLREQIADAKSRGKKELADGTPLDKAEAYAAFDGLVIARAELAKNAATAVPQERMGLTSPQQWSQRLRQAESDALAGNFEGKLALQLDSMKDELAKQAANREAVRKQLDGYNKHVPAAGGRMGELSRKAASELQAFDGGEAGPEAAAVAQAEKDMRGRVSEKLRRTDPSFAGVEKRVNDLANVNVSSAKRFAKAAEDDLREAARLAKEGADNDKLANDNKAVKVEIKDPKTGQVIGEEIQDLSGPYKIKAEGAWAAAKAKKESAERSIDNLNIELRRLRADQTLQDTNLDNAVPAKVRSWWDYDELGAGVGALETTGRNLGNLETGVSEQKQKEEKELGKKIDGELDRQKAKAR